MSEEFGRRGDGLSVSTKKLAAALLLCRHLSS